MNQTCIWSAKNKTDLLVRAQNLSGLKLETLATRLKMSVPINLKKNKGWIGLLLERYLNVKSGNKTEQDFAYLGIELKTIPVDVDFCKPLESTFVCMVRLIRNYGTSWENSYLRSKLTSVLFIPIESKNKLPLNKRRIGNPILWNLNTIEDNMLRRDWEELMDMIVLGKVKDINAYYGTWLQVRPKALNSKSLTKGIGQNGRTILTTPLGFYLRKNFTERLLQTYL